MISFGGITKSLSIYEDINGTYVLTNQPTFQNVISEIYTDQD